MLNLFISAIFFSTCFAQTITVGDLHNKYMKVLPENVSECQKRDVGNCCFSDKVLYTINFDNLNRTTNFTVTGNQVGQNCTGSYTYYPRYKALNKITPLQSFQAFNKLNQYYTVYTSQMIIKKDNKVCTRFTLQLVMNAYSQYLYYYMPTDVCDSFDKTEEDLTKSWSELIKNNNSFLICLSCIFLLFFDLL